MDIYGTADEILLEEIKEYKVCISFQKEISRRGPGHNFLANSSVKRLVGGAYQDLSGR